MKWYIIHIFMITELPVGIQYYNNNLYLLVQNIIRGALFTKYGQ